MIRSLDHLRSSATADQLFARVVEEITNRLQTGRGFELEDYVCRYPEHEERLRRLAPTIQALVELGSSPTGHWQVEASASGAALRELGDFRILREVGRGGMGIVYEAEQISLRRPVALKVLPFASVLDPRHLQRFRNEALAAASLHHTNIVPVYSVGCERGVHYYAMQFIEGHSLAEFVAGLCGQESRDKGQGPEQESEVRSQESQPRPAGGNPRDRQAQQAGLSTTANCQLSTVSSPLALKPQLSTLNYSRTVAELGIQAAEALDYAHQQGITHRDIEPSNLILDARGQLWIADFGLARIGGETNLTMTGEILGTLRYMSPEQIEAKRGIVDHRTDIYSLGATLYELLVRRPAFSGPDKPELIRRILQEDPCPPRRFDRSLPAELETIVLKCLEKAPADRYGTARELAMICSGF